MLLKPWKPSRDAQFSHPELPSCSAHPRLSRHNPHVDWMTGAILGCRCGCHRICQQTSTPQFRPRTIYLPNLTGVLSVYHNFQEVFSKAEATSLPLHRPDDCTIDLLPGTRPPCGRLCSVYASESEALEICINDSLAAGINRPSSSPAGAGFFFAAKKDNTLKPCIDNHGLNDIKDISSAFELVEGTTGVHPRGPPSLFLSGPITRSWNTSVLHLFQLPSLLPPWSPQREAQCLVLPVPEGGG